MANACDNLPERLCVSPVPVLSDIRASLCGCEYQHDCTASTWSGELHKSGRCSYSWYPLNGQPCINTKFVHPRLSYSSGVWTLQWDCFNNAVSPVTIWSGTRSNASPIGLYIRSGGCDRKPSYTVDACSSHSFVVSNLATWSDYNGSFTIASAITSQVINISNGWVLSKVGTGSTAIWTALNTNITIDCTIAPECQGSVLIDCSDGLAQTVRQPIVWKQKVAVGSAIGQYAVVPVCNEWSPYRDELLEVSITID